MIICSVCHIECPTNFNIAIFSPEYCSTLLHSLHTAELVCCSPVLRKPIYCAASLYRRLAERAEFRRNTLMFFGPPPHFPYPYAPLDHWLATKGRFLSNFTLNGQPKSGWRLQIHQIRPFWHRPNFDATTKIKPVPEPSWTVLWNRKCVKMRN